MTKVAASKERVKKDLYLEFRGVLEKLYILQFWINVAVHYFFLIIFFFVISFLIIFFNLHWFMLYFFLVIYAFPTLRC